jgi:hypothetical protein
MVKSSLGKVAWVGRTASMIFGLALVIALVFGVVSVALAGNLDPLKIGSLKNVATKTTQLVGKVATGSALVVKNPSGGPALDLRVNAGQPPLVVSSTSGTATNLSADKLDGQDSAGFLSSERTYVVTAAQNAGPNTIFSGGASCDEEDLAISGGFRSVDSTTHVEASSPNGTFQGTWNVTTRTAPTAGDSYTAYTLCADLPPLRP